MKGLDQCAAPLRLRRIKSLKRKAGFLHKGPNNSSQDIFLALLYISRSYSCFNFPPEEQEEERRKPYQHLQEVKLLDLLSRLNMLLICLESHMVNKRCSARLAEVNNHTDAFS